VKIVFANVFILNRENKREKEEMLKTKCFFDLVWSQNQYRNEIYVALIFFSKQPNGIQV
jgi:hypothetical protein